MYYHCQLTRKSRLKELKWLVQISKVVKLGQQRLQHPMIIALDSGVSLPGFEWGFRHLEEKAMAPHSSTLAWKIPWAEEPGRLQSMGSEESDLTERPHFHFSLLCIGEGNGNPLQCSCLENPRDGVAQSRTRLKWLSSSPFTSYVI